MSSINNSEEARKIFAVLSARLYSIKNGAFDYTVNFNSRSCLLTLTRNVFGLNRLTALTYLKDSVGKVVEAQGSIESIVEKLNIEEQPDPEDPTYVGRISAKEVVGTVRYLLTQELKDYYNELNRLIEELELSISDPEYLAANKIKLKLSVEDFGAFIRVLSETNFFEISNKTELYKVLVEHFVTVAGGPTVASLRNASNDPSSIGFENLIERLAQMQKTALKIKKKSNN
jgi:hypothetical protein